MDHIFKEIKEERERQDNKWGVQNHPILDPVLIDRYSQRMCEEYEIPTENRARQLVDFHSMKGDLTYFHILIEEISEIASSGRDYNNLRTEMIQAASVLIAMIESLDRNGR